MPFLNRYTCTAILCYCKPKFPHVKKKFEIFSAIGGNHETAKGLTGKNQWG